jgi:hypothetical protein
MPGRRRRRDWAGWDNGWVFKGIYGYVGEFFFDTFDDCGDHGSYHDFKSNRDRFFALHISFWYGCMGIIIPSRVCHYGTMELLDKSVNHVCSAVTVCKGNRPAISTGAA